MLICVHMFKNIDSVTDQKARDMDRERESKSRMDGGRATDQPRKNPEQLHGQLPIIISPTSI